MRLKATVTYSFEYEPAYTQPGETLEQVIEQDRVWLNECGSVEAPDGLGETSQIVVHDAKVEVAHA